MEKYYLLSEKIVIKEKSLKEKNKKITGIIFTRAFCSIGIVIFHYFRHARGNFKFLYLTANSSLGYMLVTSFFCISGVVLYYNYPKIKSIRTFYYKRWKSIFPSFYVCFTYFFLRTAVHFHRLFYKGDWSKIFITIIGFDGFLSYKINTYYLVGEWFLGAIIILYILYPIILFIVNKNNIIINNVIICFFYYLMYKTKYFIIPKPKNIISCAASFYFGIESIRFKTFYLENKKVFIISFLLLILFWKIKINIKPDMIIFQIHGFCFFITLYQLGKYVMSTKLYIIFYEISILSYGIYLYHHKIIYDILLLYNPSEWYYHIILLFFAILLTLICSKIHLMVVNSILKSYLFKKIDSFFV